MTWDALPTAADLLLVSLARESRSATRQHDTRTHRRREDACFLSLSLSLSLLLTHLCVSECVCVWRSSLRSLSLVLLLFLSPSHASLRLEAPHWSTAVAAAAAAAPFSPLRLSLATRKRGRTDLPLLPSRRRRRRLGCRLSSTAALLPTTPVDSEKGRETQIPADAFSPDSLSCCLSSLTHTRSLFRLKRR